MMLEISRTNVALLLLRAKRTHYHARFIKKTLLSRDEHRISRENGWGGVWARGNDDEFFVRGMYRSFILVRSPCWRITRMSEVNSETWGRTCATLTRGFGSRRREAFPTPRNNIQHANITRLRYVWNT